jgi:hypothetical protein
LDVANYDLRAETEQRKRTRIFYLVTQAYADIRSLSPIVAFSYDDEKTNRKLNADSIHFIADVESATRKALNDNPALIEQWERIIQQKRQVPNASSIVSRCGRLYQIRKLNPRDYFITIKRGVPGMRRVPVLAPAKTIAEAA